MGVSLRADQHHNWPPRLSPGARPRRRVVGDLALINDTSINHFSCHAERSGAERSGAGVHSVHFFCVNYRPDFCKTGSPFFARRRVASRLLGFCEEQQGFRSALLPPLFLIIANEVLIKIMELSGNPAFLLGGTGRSCRSGEAPPALERQSVHMRRPIIEGNVWGVTTSAPCFCLSLVKGRRGVVGGRDHPRILMWRLDPGLNQPLYLCRPSFLFFCPARSLQAVAGSSQRGWWGGKC